MKAFAAVVVVMAAIFLVHWRTSASMVDIWVRSETFTHCFLVLPAVLWFVWRARGQLAATEVRPSGLGLLALAASGFLWLAGELASALSPTQWAMVLMVPSAVLALFGWGWLRVLAFPLVFLFFAVPFGEVFVPTLIDWTADFTVAALIASGIPVFREGTHFVIPSGRWSVVEACSGVRYLIASVVVGVLYAWTIYRSPVRRALFIGAAILVPIVANWLRAYLIVMIGHVSSNRLAAGVDHLIYGWVFFGVVIAVMFWIGARWREDDEPDATGAGRVAPATMSAAVAASRVRPPAAAIIAAAVLVIAWPVVQDLLLSGGDRRPVQAATVVATGGWVETPVPPKAWRPELEGPAQTQVVSFSKDGATVTVFVGHYRNQRQGSELVNSMNRLVPEERAEWEQIARGRADAVFGTAPTAIGTATVRRAGERLRVWHFYWLDDRFEASDTRAKLSLALDRLLLRSDASAWVALSTAAESDADGDLVLSAFARDMGPALQKALSEAAAR